MSFRRFLDHAGAPGERYFRRQGLPALCSDPNALVPLSRAWSLFAETARQEDPLLGWRVGSFAGDRIMNQDLVHRLEGAQTLYLALGRLVRHARAEASHLDLAIQERPDEILLVTHGASLRETSGYHVAQAYRLAIFIELVRGFLGRSWVPSEIGIESSTVPTGLSDQFPECRILSRQPVGYLAIPRRYLLGRPAGHFRNRVSDSVAMTDELDFVATLIALLKAYLADGYPTASFAAELMGTSERTLVRALSSRSLTYGDVVDDVRFRVAADHLHETDRRITDISLSVGFDDPAHFARMFRRVAGLSPREYRQRARRDGLPGRPAA